MAPYMGPTQRHAQEEEIRGVYGQDVSAFVSDTESDYEVENEEVDDMDELADIGPLHRGHDPRSIYQLPEYIVLEGVLIDTPLVVSNRREVLAARYQGEKVPVCIVSNQTDGNMTKLLAFAKIRKLLLEWYRDHHITGSRIFGTGGAPKEVTLTLPFSMKTAALYTMNLTGLLETTKEFFEELFEQPSGIGTTVDTLMLTDTNYIQVIQFLEYQSPARLTMNGHMYVARHLGLSPSNLSINICEATAVNTSFYDKTFTTTDQRIHMIDMVEHFRAMYLILADRNEYFQMAQRKDVWWTKLDDARRPRWIYHTNEVADMDDYYEKQAYCDKMVANIWFINRTSTLPNSTVPHDYIIRLRVLVRLPFKNVVDYFYKIIHNLVLDFEEGEKQTGGAPWRLAYYNMSLSSDESETDKICMDRRFIFEDFNDCDDDNSRGMLVNLFTNEDACMEDGNGATNMCLINKYKLLYGGTNVKDLYTHEIAATSFSMHSENLMCLSPELMYGPYYIAHSVLLGLQNPTETDRYHDMYQYRVDRENEKQISMMDFDFEERARTVYEYLYDAYDTHLQIKRYNPPEDVLKHPLAGRVLPSQGRYTCTGAKDGSAETRCIRCVQESMQGGSVRLRERRWQRQLRRITNCGPYDYYHSVTRHIKKPHRPFYPFERIVSTLFKYN